MRKKSTHLNYAMNMITLMFFTAIFTSTLIFFIGKAGRYVNYTIIVVYALVSGLVCAKFIDKVSHKDKKEILAGALIPLPVVICMTVYLLVLNNLRFVDTVSPVVSSCLFFVCFNVPFLVLLYEHDRHKHHLIGFAVAPLVLAAVYMFAYFLTLSIAADYISPQVLDSFAVAYDIVPAKSFVESCIKSIGEDAVMKGVDVKDYLDSRIDGCIDSFSQFRDFSMDHDSYSSEVVYGDYTVSITVYYPMSFVEGNFNYGVSDFNVIIER